ncbi:hypothetical protein MSIM_03730 [Mycobacterium simiae]|nr:hypothetical protein MSIM_03730 [Mycobacterium simiae]
MADNIAASVLGVVALTPSFPRAACRGSGELYDRASDGDAPAQRDAVAICNGCPERARCAGWVAGLSDRERRQLGVVGGECFAPERNADALAKVGRRNRPKRHGDATGTGEGVSAQGTKRRPQRAKPAAAKAAS